MKYRIERISANGNAPETTWARTYTHTYTRNTRFCLLSSLLFLLKTGRTLVDRLHRRHRSLIFFVALLQHTFHILSSIRLSLSKLISISFDEITAALRKNGIYDPWVVSHDRWSRFRIENDTKSRSFCISFSLQNSRNDPRALPLRGGLTFLSAKTMFKSTPRTHEARLFLATAAFRKSRLLSPI